MLPLATKPGKKPTYQIFCLNLGFIQCFRPGPATREPDRVVGLPCCFSYSALLLTRAVPAELAGYEQHCQCGSCGDRSACRERGGGVARLGGGGSVAECVIGSRAVGHVCRGGRRMRLAVVDAGVAVAGDDTGQICCLRAIACGCGGRPRWPPLWLLWRWRQPPPRRAPGWSRRSWRGPACQRWRSCQLRRRSRAGHCRH